MTQPFFSKKSRIKLKILAWYQILGGVFGVLISLYSLAQVDRINGLILIIYLVVFGLYSYSIYCGRLLFTDKYSLGFRLSIINQVLQILTFSICGYGFMYISGGMLLGEIKFTDAFKMGINFSLTSTWQITFNSDDKPFQLGLNFVAIYLVYFADKLNITIRREKIIYEEDLLSKSNIDFGEANLLT